MNSYASRRARADSADAGRGGGVAILPTAPEVMRNRDADYPYRHDSYFYYLSGFTEPEAVLVLVAGAEKRPAILFCREKNLEREIWDGYRHGPEAAREQFGFDAAFPIDALDERNAETAGQCAGAVLRARQRSPGSMRRCRPGCRACACRRAPASPRRRRCTTCTCCWTRCACSRTTAKLQ